jgi:hypothetical protein
MIKLKDLLKEFQDFGGGMGTVYGAEEVPYKEEQIDIAVNKDEGPENVVGMARIGTFPGTNAVVAILENDKYSSTYPLYIKWKATLDKFYTSRGDEVVPNDEASAALLEKLKKKTKLAGQDR